MHLRTTLVTFGFFTAAAAGSVGGDLLADFYGNTLISHDRGIESRFYYKPDHTFTGKVPTYSMEFKGTWEQKPDGIICRTFDPPLPTLKNPDCGPMPVRQVGERHKDPNGDSAKLVAGIK